MNMKKIMILLLSVFTLYSCKNDVEEVDWTVDTLAITSEGNQLQDAGDGNLKMVLPTEFSGVIKLNVESNNPWIAEVSDITIQEEQWITLSSAEGTGNGTFDINIAPNNSAIDRIGSVVVTTTGNIPVKKTITLIQGNTDDMLSIGFDGVVLPEGVTVKEEVEGSWNMTLPVSLSTSEELCVVVSTTSFPEIKIEYPSDMQKDWIILKQDVDARDSEVRNVIFTVTENSLKDYREAIVKFVSKSGDFEVEKTLSISQLGEENIIWCGEYYQGSISEPNKSEIILPSYKLQDIKIAELKNIKSSNIELQSNDWFTLSINESGEVLLTITKENVSTNKENITELVLSSKISGAKFRIPVRQCMSGHGISLNKQLWNLKGVGNKRELEHEKCIKLCDNAWGTSEKTSGTYFEIGNNDRDSGTPYNLYVDLGESYVSYNSIGLMPRLAWTACSPKTVEIQVSDTGNEDDWQTIVSKEDGNGFKKDEICHAHTEWREDQKDGSSYNDWKAHWEAPVKWYSIPEGYRKRYICIKMYETFGNENNSNSNNLCIDELFVTNRETE